MEALTERREAAEGWAIKAEALGEGFVRYAAVPPTARHYLAGMTPGAANDGRLAYLFLRPDVAEATIAAHAQIRGAES